MPVNTDAQRARKKDARLSAGFHAVLLLIAAGLILFLRGTYPFSGWVRALLLLTALSDLGMLIPIWISLKIRLKEIEGGEEDAAAQY